MMIASYTNDDDRHCDDYCIVHIVYALAMYVAIFFGDGRRNKEILGVGFAIYKYLNIQTSNVK